MSGAPRARSAGPGGPGARRRATLSRESVVTEAAALLDEEGAGALTFRALAARLGGGVASIYWYVANKDELLDRATDHVLGQVLEETGSIGSDDPIADLRGIAIVLFEVIREHPWTGAYLMRDVATQPQSFAVYERLGRQVMRLGLDARDTFYGASGVLGFVIGTAIDLGHQPPESASAGEPDATGGQALMEAYMRQWRELDPEEFPFIRYTVEEVAIHDDAEQFRAGLELILAGLAQQAAGAERRRPVPGP